MNASPSDMATVEILDGDPATYEQLQRGYEEMRDLCRQAQDGWNAERRKLRAVQAAIAAAICCLEAEGNTGSGYVNRIWGAKNVLKKAQA